MRIEFKTAFMTMNKIEKTVYYNSLPEKDFINHQRIDLMFEAIITNLILTRGFSKYLNSLKANTEHVWIYVIIARVDLGKEVFRIKLPEITSNLFSLDLLRTSYINSEDKFMYTTYYYEQIYRQMEANLKNSKLLLDFLNRDFIKTVEDNNTVLGTNKIYVKVSNINEGFNNKEQLSIFKKYK
jgi:hypothetical protein